MADRRPIQQAHERAFVDYFLDWFNRAYHSDFKVISEPNPPEAVIRSSRTTRWVEVSTAFWNEQYAKDLYSLATPGEAHKSVGNGPFQDMDNFFSGNFVSVVKKKLEKKSYIPWRDKYGPGYLVLPIKYPWFDGKTVACMRDRWAATTINILGCFRGIYMACPSPSGKGIKLCRWTSK